MFKGVATNYKLVLSFVYLDGKKHLELARKLTGNPSPTLPTVAIEDMASDQHFSFPFQDITTDTLSDWCTQFIANELQPTVLSDVQPVPETLNGLTLWVQRF